MKISLVRKINLVNPHHADPGFITDMDPGGSYYLFNIFLYFI